MNPITDLDYWLNLGNFLAATAVALFAIKSGYFENKLNDLYITIEKLNELKETVVGNYKDRYGEEMEQLPKFDRELAESLGNEFSRLSNLHITRLIHTVEVIGREEKDYAPLVNDSFINFKKDICMLAKSKEELDINVIRNNHLKNDSYKPFLIISYHTTNETIRAKNSEYDRLFSTKRRFDGFISSKRILYLFAAGIVIQLMSLLVSIKPFMILMILVFSPAIIIVVVCLFLLFDEIISI